MGGGGEEGEGRGGKTGMLSVTVKERSSRGTGSGGSSSTVVSSDAERYGGETFLPSEISCENLVGLETSYKR